MRGPENRGVALPLEHRLLEKPFAVTEFDYCFPNPSRGGGALAAGALAALQDTDARRILVGHLRDVKNSGMEFEDETCRIMKTKGGVPLLARKATVTPDGSVSFFHEIAL